LPEGGLENSVYLVPEEVDMAVARLKLEALGVEIDRLTPEQMLRKLAPRYMRGDMGVP